MTRNEMLQRIRTALGRQESTPRTPLADGYFTALPQLGQIMPPSASDDLVSTFEFELQKLSGASHRAASSSELDAALRTILTSCQAKTVVLSRNPLLSQLGVESRLRSLGIDAMLWPAAGAEVHRNQSESFREACFSAQAGITGVDSVLVESGSLVLTSQTEGSQLASLAPPVHIALYRRSQVFATLEEVLERLVAAGNSSVPALGRSVVFVTGTSRTADIEQILIRGVHGPGQVHAVLVEDDCLP